MTWLGDLGSALLGALYANIVLATVGGIVALGVGALVARRLGWIAAARRHPARTGALVVAGLAIALPVGWYLASPLVVSAEVDDPAPIVASRPSPAATTPSRTEGPGAPSAPATTPTPTPTVPPSRPLGRSGAFHGSDEFHFGRGVARLIEIEPGRYVVRLEDFAVRNGPDLYVYLSPSVD